MSQDAFVQNVLRFSFYTRQRARLDEFHLNGNSQCGFNAAADIFSEFFKAANLIGEGLFGQLNLNLQRIQNADAVNHQQVIRRCSSIFQED